MLLPQLLFVETILIKWDPHWLAYIRVQCSLSCNNKTFWFVWIVHPDFGLAF